MHLPTRWFFEFKIPTTVTTKFQVDIYLNIYLKLSAIAFKLTYM